MYKRQERFLETAILGAASFKAIGFLQWGFSDRALELGRLSVMFSRGWLSWLLLLFFSICLIVLLQFEEKKGKAAVEKEWGKWKKKLRLICIIGVLSAAVLALLLIIGNTAGLWEKWFGITFHNQYLLFDNKWGSDRGFTWKAAAGMFAEMTPLRKLFGAGPDCFKAYSYRCLLYTSNDTSYSGKRRFYRCSGSCGICFSRRVCKNRER